MKVRAIQLGYYGHKRRKPGEVFDLQPVKLKDGSMVPVEKQFSKKWMEPMGGVKGKKPKEADKMAENEESSNSEVI